MLHYIMHIFFISKFLLIIFYRGFAKYKHRLMKANERPKRNAITSDLCRN